MLTKTTLVFKYAGIDRLLLSWNAQRFAPNGTMMKRYHALVPKRPNAVIGSRVPVPETPYSTKLSQLRTYAS